MTGNWARTEHVRGKGSAANCMLCGRKPHILEKRFYDGSHIFTICCPYCWNKHFKDKRETGVDITVVAENVYAAIRDWNKINTRGIFWRPKPLPRATHCIVAIKWAEDDIEVTEEDTTFILKENSERIVAWMPLPAPPKGRLSGMKPEEAIPLLQRGLVGEIYDEKGYLTALGYEALDAIDSSKCPTLVQRPHGEWITKKDSLQTFCSNCDKAIPYSDEYDFYDFILCPYCGADMRDKKDDLAEIGEAVQSMKEGRWQK